MIHLGKINWTCLTHPTFFLLGSCPPARKKLEFSSPSTLSKPSSPVQCACTWESNTTSFQALMLSSILLTGLIGDKDLILVPICHSSVLLIGVFRSQVNKGARSRGPNSMDCFLSPSHSGLSQMTAWRWCGVQCVGWRAHCWLFPQVPLAWR